LNWPPIGEIVNVSSESKIKSYKFIILAIDPCSVNRCQHRCRSYNGQAQCECLPGFELAYDQRSCIAKDGCTLNNGGCEQECVQAATQHRCSCRQGFELNEDQRSCRGKFLNSCGINAFNAIALFASKISKFPTFNFCFNCLLYPVEMLAFTAPESLTNTIDYQTSGIKELDGLKSCIYQPEGKCHKLCMDFSTGQTFCTCQKGYFLSADDLHTCQGIFKHNSLLACFCTHRLDNSNVKFNLLRYRRVSPRKWRL
jgi:fibulin 1/2